MAPTRIALLISLLAIAAQRITAQQPAAVQSENGVYTLHADTHLVLLDVTVTDNHKHPVAGLTQDNFKLLEDGQPQTIKFFEEHAPVDPAEIALQKAAAVAGQLNTFTNYEPFTGRPVTVLLLNELFRASDFNPQRPERSFLRSMMIEAVQSAPPDTPFAIYMLDSELHLVQPVTTDRALLRARINVLWKTPQFGSERMINPTGLPPEADIPVRRRFTSDAMRQLASSLKAQPGRKNLFVFTGGFHCSVVGPGTEFLPDCPDIPFPNDSMDYLCGLMDTLEQGRMSIYRVYPMPGEVGYGFGCSASADLGSSANYYTLYYTPTNGDWNGKYRATTVEVADKKGLHLTYRKGYYGTPENADAHYYTAQRPAAPPVAQGSGGAGSNGPTIGVTTVAPVTADSASLSISTTEAKSTPQIQLLRQGSGSLSAGAAGTAPNPAAAVFSVQVVPADATVVPGSAASVNEKGKKKQKQEQAQEYRQLTLHFSMPASEFKVVKSDAGQYAARLEIEAVGYAGGKSLETYASQLVANFNSADDPRIAMSTITATLTVNILEHGESRWLNVSVLDVATGQLGSMVIPMEQVKMPGVDEIPTEWTKLPSEQTAGSNVAADHAPSSTPPTVVDVESVKQQPTPNVADIDNHLPPPPAKFDVAVIQPSHPGEIRFKMNAEGNTVHIQYATLQTLISGSFNIPSWRIVNKPKWLDGQHYDIIGNIATSDASPIQGVQPSVGIDDAWEMTRSILASRFKLTTHTDQQPSDVYALLTAKPKMKKAAKPNMNKANPERSFICYEAAGVGGNPVLSRHISCQNITMSQLTTELSSRASGYLPVPVIDATGLGGTYDFTLNFSNQTDLKKPGAISLFDAMKKQLGLKLEKRDKFPMPVLVIDHIEEQPTDN